MRACVQIAVATACWAVACLPVFHWYLGRLFSYPAQAWLFLAPATAISLMYRNSGPAPRDIPSHRWIAPVLLMAAYAAAFPFLPMTLNAALSVACLLFIPGTWRRGFLPDPAVSGLFFIGLPAVMMLQFYFGYPLRVVSAAIALPMLKGAGFDVIREGTMFIRNGLLISVDAPCSGIRMGWMALYVAFTVCGFSGFGWIRSLFVVSAAIVLAVFVNAMRIAVLFGMEAAGMGNRSIPHAGAGAAMFLALALMIVMLAVLLKRRTT